MLLAVTLVTNLLCMIAPASAHTDYCSNQSFYWQDDYKYYGNCDGNDYGYRNYDYDYRNDYWKNSTYYEQSNCTVRIVPNHWRVTVIDCGDLIATDDWGRTIRLPSKEYDRCIISGYNLTIMRGSEVRYVFKANDGYSNCYPPNEWQRWYDPDNHHNPYQYWEYRYNN